MKAKSLVLLMLLALGGCAAKGPVFTQPPAAPDGYARVVIYRQHSLSGAAWTHHYFIDRTPVAELRVGGYTTLVARPGSRLFHYNVLSDDELLPFGTVLEAGQTYYLKEGQHLKSYVPVGIGVGFASHEYRFGPVPPDIGVKEVAKYRYQAPLVDAFEGQ